MPPILTIARAGAEGRAAWAWMLTDGDRVLRRSRGSEPGASGYRTELAGLVAGLAEAPTGPVVVQLANQSLLRTGAEWVHAWRRQGWKKKGGRIQHLDLVQALASQLERVDPTWRLVDKGGDAYKAARESAREAAAALPERPAQPRTPDAVAPTAAALVAYTDGGCRGNPGGPGGWGMLLIHVGSGRALEKRGGEAETTNNRMEVTAAIEALQALKAPGQDIELRTDSRYLKDMAESWMAGWKRRGWRKRSGEPVANLDLVQALDVLLQQHRVRWTWVKGHAGEAGNEHADALTNAAMDAVQAGEDPNASRRFADSPVRVPRG